MLELFGGRVDACEIGIHAVEGQLLLAANGVGRAATLDRCEVLPEVDRRAGREASAPGEAGAFAGSSAELGITRRSGVTEVTGVVPFTGAIGVTGVAHVTRVAHATGVSRGIHRRGLCACAEHSDRDP